MLKVTSSTQNANAKTAVRYAAYSPDWEKKSKKSANTKCWQAWAETGALTFAAGDESIKWHQDSGEQSVTGEL